MRRSRLRLRPAQSDSSSGEEGDFCRGPSSATGQRQVSRLRPIATPRGSSSEDEAKRPFRFRPAAGASRPGRTAAEVFDGASGAGPSSFREAAEAVPRPPPAVFGLPLASEESEFSRAGFTVPVFPAAGAAPAGMSLQQTMLEHAAPSGVMRPLSRRPSAHTADSGASTSGSEVDPAMPPPLRAGQPLRRRRRSAEPAAGSDDETPPRVPGSEEALLRSSFFRPPPSPLPSHAGPPSRPRPVLRLGARAVDAARPEVLAPRLLFARHRDRPHRRWLGLRLLGPSG